MLRGSAGAAGSGPERVGAEETRAGGSRRVPPVTPPGAMQAAHQVRQLHLEIRQQRQVGAGAGDLLEIERRRHQRFVEERASHDQVAARAGYQRSTDEPLAALESDELGERDVHPVLARNVLHQPLPPEGAGGATAFDRLNASRRAGARHQDELRPVQRADRRHDRVPCVLAHEEHGAPPVGLERCNTASRLDEPLLVEHAVRRQEDLPMHVPDGRTAPSQRSVDRRVVQPVAMHFVEAERDVEGWCGRFPVDPFQVAEQLLRRHGEIADTPLKEVAGERRFGSQDQPGGRGPARRLPEHGT